MQITRSISDSFPMLRDIDMKSGLTASEFLAAQWRNPSDILSVLMLLGPEIVQKAIAQLTGRIITPVAFSFGWVAFAASSILRVVSGMPVEYVLPALPPTDHLLRRATDARLRYT